MYTPKFNEQNDLAVLHEFIKARPFATWAALVDGELEVQHIPFVLHEERSEYGTLVGHVARDNPIWNSLPSATESVMVFQGPHGYISPAWYPSKQEHGKAVPTWNYMVVHARGCPRTFDDAQKILEHIIELTDIHEQGQHFPWTVADAPEGFIDRLVRAIVGIEMPISQLQGKWKLGQNRSVADQMGMVTGLTYSGAVGALELAEAIRQNVQNNSSD